MSNTISDVLSRIGTIQQQMQELQNGSLLDSQLGTSGGAGLASTGGASSGNFANQLAAAQNTTGTGTATAGTPNASALFSPLSGSALGAGATTSPLATPSATATATPLATGAINGLAGPGGASLPASAGSMLTSGQQQFAATLSAETGLNPGVVTSWVLAEESGGAAQSRQAANNNDWLNIGYTDSATYGASDSVWSDPVAAANATAQWLKGQNSIPGYGTASSGIQAILNTVGQTPAAQIQAIQGSGWASGGYPSLPALYSQVTGS